MFNSPVIDLVILLSFTYFIGSLILSAITEALAGGLRLRPKQLKSGIENMFFTRDWKIFVQKQFSKSPHIQSLMRDSGRYPAYIPAKSFVHAIVEQFRKAQQKQAATSAENQSELMDNNALIEYKSGSLGRSISNGELLVPHCLKEILIDFAVQVEAIYPEGKQIEEFEKRLEEFYDSTMDRVGGWYKRKNRTILLTLGIALSVALNIDTLNIIDNALADKQKLRRAVDNISANIKDIESLQSIHVTDTSVEISQKAIGDTNKDIQKIRLEFEQTTGYGFGYRDFFDEWKADFWKKLFGILITAFALQLGSNYWFDLMNKAVNIRAAGKRPDEKRPPQDVPTTPLKP